MTSLTLPTVLDHDEHVALIEASGPQQVVSISFGSRITLLDEPGNTWCLPILTRMRNPRPSPEDVLKAIEDHRCGCHFRNGIAWFCGIHADRDGRKRCYMDTDGDGGCGKRYCPFCGSKDKPPIRMDIPVDA